MPVQADLATTGGVDELWSSVQSMGSTLDIACVSAGVGVGGLFRETDLNEELNMINLNCSGTVLLAKYVVQHMLQQKSEKILFTASSAGATPTSFATRSKYEIAIRAKITSNDGGAVCGLCGEKNPLGNLRRISIQDVQSREIIVCFHRGRQILRDRYALKNLRCSRVCWGMRDSALLSLPHFEGSTPCCCEQLNKGFYVLTDPVEDLGKAKFVPAH